MRMIVSLPDEQAARLAEVCRRRGISRTEAVRRAIAVYLDAHRTGAREDAFGIWRGRYRDGVTYQRRLREGWS